MGAYLKKIIVFISIKAINGTIDGLSYLDELNHKRFENTWLKGENPCNPLYWYPKHIPEYCKYKQTRIPPMPTKYEGGPVPMPIPVPYPMLPVPHPGIIAPAPPQTIIPHHSPFGIPFPLINSMIPAPAYSAPSPPAVQQYPLFSSVYSSRQASMVPGLPGIVTHDGGINILPFSDAYSDLLEKHKQKMIRRKLQKIIRDYENFPRSRKKSKKIYSEEK